MSTFGDGGRDLSGWTPVLELADGLFAHPDNHDLRAGILYDRQMPEVTPLHRSAPDIKAGTSVTWNRQDDDLDHHWQVRRIERLAPAWRSLIPSVIDHQGWADAECTIELKRGRVEAIASRENGTDTDSSIAIIHEAIDGRWIARVEVSWVYDDPDSDILAIDAAGLAEVVEHAGWHLHGALPTGHRVIDGMIIVDIPVSALADIDREAVPCAA